MRLGVCVPNYGDYSIDDFRKVSLEAETLGYDSVWTTDHVLMSRNSGTPYERILESITSLAYLAPLTEKVRLGISSLIVAMRNPIIAAKQLATLDCLSSGRLMLGVGAGWNEKEFRTLGAKFHARGRRVDESIRLIRSLWEGPAEGGLPGGKPFSLELGDVVFEPRPVQKRLTIWIGGVSDAAMRRAITLGDAWHPNVAPLDEFQKLVEKFRGMSGGKEKDICVRIGLDIRAQSTEYLGSQGERRVRLSSDRSANEAILQRLSELGVEYAVVATSPDGTVPVSAQIEGLRTLQWAR